MSDITKMDLEQHDQLARNIASELAIGDNAQVLTIIKTGLALAYKNGRESAPATPAATPMAARCLDCQKEYGGEDWIDLTLTKEQWLLLNPNDGGILCANCMIARAAKLPHVINMVGRISFAEDYDDRWQNLPAAAQPQRESEQPEQALRDRIVEAAARYLMAKPEEDAGDWCDAFDQLHEQVSLFYGSEDHSVWRAALSPQTDSLSTQQGGPQHG